MSEGYEEALATMVKKLRDIHNSTIFEREQVYGSRLKGSRVGGDIELFA